VLRHACVECNCNILRILRGNTQWNETRTGSFISPLASAYSNTLTPAFYTRPDGEFVMTPHGISETKPKSRSSTVLYLAVRNNCLLFMPYLAMHNAQPTFCKVPRRRSGSYPESPFCFPLLLYFLQLFVSNLPFDLYHK
jgi:hypothetical protein